MFKHIILTLAASLFISLDAIQFSSQDNDCLEVQDVQENFSSVNIRLFNRCPATVSGVLCVIHKDNRTQIVRRNNIPKQRPWRIYLQNPKNNPIQQIIISSRMGVTNVPAACQAKQ